MRRIVFLCTFLLSFNAFSSDCSLIDERIHLNDFIFRVSRNGNLKATLRKNVYGVDVSFFLMGDFKNNSVIQLKNSEGKSCKKISFEADPALLCRDADGAVEPWSYWVFNPGGEAPPEYSIVSTRTNYDEETFIRNSRVCGYSTFLGKIVIQNSNIESTSPSRATQSKIMSNGSAYIADTELKGKFLFEDQSTGTGEIILKNTTIEGDPKIKTFTKRIYLEKVKVTGNPTIEEKVPLGFTADSVSSVFIYESTIVGSPNIKGGLVGGGADLRNTNIQGSPTIIGEMIFDGVTIENSGTYTAEAKLHGTIMNRSVIFGDILLKGNNNFSGFYFVNKYIENSTIEGSVVYDGGGAIANVANLTNTEGLNKKFISSTFKGIGFILGTVEGGVTINGYEVSGNYAGINFCDTCRAHNGSKLSGAIYTQGSVDLDNADVAGTSLRDGLYIQDIRDSLVQNSKTTGNVGIINSTVLNQSIVSGNSAVYQSVVNDSTVSGDAQLYDNSSLTQKSTATGSADIANSSVTNQSLVNQNAIVVSSFLNGSTATCNAYVYNESLSGQFAGCNYPNKKNQKRDEFLQKEIIQNIANNVLKLVEKNDQAKKFKSDVIQKHYQTRIK